MTCYEPVSLTWILIILAVVLLAACAAPVDVLPSPCLAKMEAAMRAMEKWHDIEGDMLQRLQAGDILKDLEVKWSEAKRDCWRKP